MTSTDDRDADDRRKLAARELTALTTRPSAFLDEIAGVAQRFNVSVSIYVHPLEVEVNVAEDELSEGEPR